MDSLLFVGARMIDSLVQRAATRAMSFASVDVHLELEGKRAHRLTIRPALPSIDRKFLLKLCNSRLPPIRRRQPYCRSRSARRPASQARCNSACLRRKHQSPRGWT